MTGVGGGEFERARRASDAVSSSSGMDARGMPVGRGRAQGAGGHHGRGHEPGSLLWWLDWARTREGLRATEKHVLSALAARVDRSGVCFPGVNLIASDTSLSPRAVREATKDLEAKGLLKRVRRYRSSGDGGRTSNAYRLAPGVLAADAGAVDLAAASASIPLQEMPNLGAGSAGQEETSEQTKGRDQYSPQLQAAAGPEVERVFGLLLTAWHESEVLGADDEVLAWGMFQYLAQEGMDLDAVVSAAGGAVEYHSLRGWLWQEFGRHLRESRAVAARAGAPVADSPGAGPPPGVDYDLREGLAGRVMS